MNPAECGGAHEGQGRVTNTDRFERMQKIEGRERENLQTLLLGQLCLAATGVQNQNQRAENEYRKLSCFKIRSPWDHYTCSEFYRITGH